MIIKVKAATEQSFIISGNKPDTSVAHTLESQQGDAEAIFFTLTTHLPAGTLGDLVKIFMTYGVIAELNPAYEKFGESAKEREIT